MSRRFKTLSYGKVVKIGIVVASECTFQPAVFIQVSHVMRLSQLFDGGIDCLTATGNRDNPRVKGNTGGAPV